MCGSGTTRVFHVILATTVSLLLFFHSASCFATRLPWLRYLVYLIRKSKWDVIYNRVVIEIKPRDRVTVSKICAAIPYSIPFNFFFSMQTKNLNSYGTFRSLSLSPSLLVAIFITVVVFSSSSFISSFSLSASLQFYEFCYFLFSI